jgi:hypothetical protein
MQYKDIILEKVLFIILVILASVEDKAINTRLSLPRECPDDITGEWQPPTPPLCST